MINFIVSLVVLFAQLIGAGLVCGMIMDRFERPWVKHLVMYTFCPIAVLIIIWLNIEVS